MGKANTTEKELDEFVDKMTGDLKITITHVEKEGLSIQMEGKPLHIQAALLATLGGLFGTVKEHDEHLAESMRESSIAALVEREV